MAAGTLTVRILGDTAPLKKSLGEAEGAANSFGSKLSGVGKKMQSFGRTATIGMTLPIVALGKVAFDAASDLEESLSKVNVVFGKNAKEVEAWAKNSATAFGQSKQQALEAAGTYGNLFQAFGVGRDESTKMSKSLVELAADLASFNNTSVDEALVALRSGLSGEAEPLKRYGVAINDIRLKEEARKLGLIKTTKDALTPGAKAQAAYALIMKDSTLAQGDFARTSKGAANQSKIMKARLADASATLGTAFLPILTKVIGFVSKLAEKFGNLSPTVQKFILAAAGLLAVLGPLVAIIGTLVTVIGFLAANPIVLIIAGIAALAVGLFVAYQKFEAFRNIVDGAWQILQDAWDVITKIATAVVDFGTKAVGFLADWTPVGQMLQKLPEVLELVRDAFQWVIGKVKTLIEWIKKLPEVIDKALGPLDELLGKAGKALADNQLRNRPSDAPPLIPGRGRAGGGNLSTKSADGMNMTVNVNGLGVEDAAVKVGHEVMWRFGRMG